MRKMCRGVAVHDGHSKAIRLHKEPEGVPDAPVRMFSGKLPHIGISAQLTRQIEVVDVRNAIRMAIVFQFIPLTLNQFVAWMPIAAIVWNRFELQSSILGRRNCAAIFTIADL